MRVVIPQITWHSRDPVLTLDFDPRGKTEQGYYRLATGGGDRLLLIWHLANPEALQPEIICVSELTRHQKAVNVCRFSPCGGYIASGDDDAYVFIWKNESVAAKEEIWTVEKIFRRHVEDVSDLSWSQDGNFLVSGSVDNTAVLWDVKKGSVLHFWSEREHTGFVQGVAYDPLGEISATMCIDRTLRFFNNKTGKSANKALKYPPAWLGTSEQDDAKENKPEIVVEQNVEKSCACKDAAIPQPQAEGPDEKDKPLSDVNGMDVDVEEQEPKLPPKRPVYPLNRLFHDDTLKTFCRRLSFSPKGELLIVPGGLLPPVEKEEVSRQSTPADDEDSKETASKRFDPEQNNAAIIFCRHSWTNPCAVIPTGASYSIAARFNPVYYERVRQAYEYDPEYVNSNKRSERVVSCIARLRPPRQEQSVLLNMPYRLVYAVATNDSILIGDTSSGEPLACLRNIHCTRMTDVAWSPDGLIMIASSTDGYCSVVSFAEGELGIEFKPEEFPTLTPDCFPIAPPEPKPVRKKVPKEQKEPQEKTEEKEKEAEKVIPVVPVKEEKKKKTLTLFEMGVSKTGVSPGFTPTRSPIRSSERQPEVQKSQSSSAESLLPAPVSQESLAAAASPKPTFMDGWVKKTPKSSTNEGKQPRRIQLKTLPSSTKEDKQPRRIELTTLSSSTSQIVPSTSNIPKTSLVPTSNGSKSDTSTSSSKLAPTISCPSAGSTGIGLGKVNGSKSPADSGKTTTRTPCSEASANDSSINPAATETANVNKSGKNCKEPPALTATCVNGSTTIAIPAPSSQPLSEPASTNGPININTLSTTLTTSSNAGASPVQGAGQPVKQPRRIQLVTLE